MRKYVELGLMFILGLPCDPDISGPRIGPPLISLSPNKTAAVSFSFRLSGGALKRRLRMGRRNPGVGSCGAI
jgi:hypothetical protein